MSGLNVGLSDCDRITQFVHLNPLMRLPDVEMKQISKIWLSLYGLICIGVLLPLGIWQIRDPLAVKPLLVNGGLSESLPAIVFVLASLLSLAPALQLRQARQNYKGWALYSGLCLFFAGEEASWGQDRILAWQALNPLGTERWDLQNWGTNLLDSSLKILGWRFALLGAVVMIVFGMLLLLRFKKRGKRIRALWQDRWNRLPQTFFFLGLVLIILGNFYDTLHEIGLPYFRGQWPLEESLELLGSIAFLFVVLSKMHAQVQSSKNLSLRQRFR